MAAPCRAKGRRFPWWAALFWLAVWQAGAMWLDKEILLVSPARVFLRLTELVPHVDFWQAVLSSFSRITAGFFLACLAGALLAAGACRWLLLRELCAPLMATVKSIPVASFIILVLVWVPSRSLSVVISFLMVLPILYQNLLAGLDSMDKKLDEMAGVFQVAGLWRARYLVLPQVAPFFRTACALALGMAWKAGVAAEVIGLPAGSVGQRLYNAKVYLETPDLFAWTLVIILVSLLFERLFLALVDAALGRLA